MIAAVLVNKRIVGSLQVVKPITSFYRIARGRQKLSMPIMFDSKKYFQRLNKT